MPPIPPRIRFDLRPMTTADIADAHRLSLAVGWPHRAVDLQFVLDIGQGVVSTIDDRVVGTAMWWVFEDRIARVGMVIVDPALQKAGMGKALMQSAFDAITAPTVILCATAAGEPLYQRLGFVRTGSIMQYQGVPCAVPTATSPETMRIRPAEPGDAETIIALDAEASGVRRDRAIGYLLAHAEAVVAETASGLRGFAICRRFGRGELIGPVVAGDVVTAKALFAHWVAMKPGAFLRVDVPDETGLGAWFEAHGLAPIAPAFNMVRGPAAKPKGEARVFGLANQAIG